MAPLDSAEIKTH